MQPSHKSVNMKEFMDKISQEIFGQSRTEAIESDICVDCGLPAVEFKDQLSRKEYSISGLCQECQNKIWG